jgi:hypothetical protein
MIGFCDGSVRFFQEGGDVNNLRWLALAMSDTRRSRFHQVQGADSS